MGARSTFVMVKALRNTVHRGGGHPELLQQEYVFVGSLRSRSPRRCRWLGCRGFSQGKRRPSTTTTMCRSTSPLSSVSASRRCGVWPSSSGSHPSLGTLCVKPWRRLVVAHNAAAADARKKSPTSQHLLSGFVPGSERQPWKRAHGGLQRCCGSIESV